MEVLCESATDFYNFFSRKCLYASCILVSIPLKLHLFWILLVVIMTVFPCFIYVHFRDIQNPNIVIQTKTQNFTINVVHVSNFLLIFICEAWETLYDQLSCP